MALAWKVSWEQSLKGSNPLSSANLKKGSNVKLKSKLKYLIIRIFTLGPLIFRKRINKYDNSVLSESILTKTLKYLNSEMFESKQLPTQIKVMKNSQKGVKFLDIGGGAGIHYFEYVKNFPNTKLKWYVVENKILVNMCSNNKYLKKIKFYNSLKKINGKSINFDVAFLNSSIQYFPDPIQTLNEIIDTKAKYIWFERTPLADANRLIYLHQYSRLSDNGPGDFFEGKNRIVKYPLKIIPRTIFETLLSKKYKIIMVEISQPHRLRMSSKGYVYYKYIWERREKIEEDV
jgi:putative methyltransferase (TIGR04325 family)